MESMNIFVYVLCVYVLFVSVCVMCYVRECYRTQILPAIVHTKYEYITQTRTHTHIHTHTVLSVFVLHVMCGSTERLRSYRVAKNHRMSCLYRSFSAKEPYS